MLTTEINHFCTPVVLATPLRARINPPLLEGKGGESWYIEINLDYLIDEFGLGPAIDLAGVDFNAGPRLSVETGTGDLFGLLPLQPGESLTLVQNDTNRFEAAGEGFFSATVTINLPGVEQGNWLDYREWTIPTGPMPTATLPPDFYRPQVTDTGTEWTFDDAAVATDTVPFGNIRPHSAYEWGPLDQMPPPTSTDIAPFSSDTAVWSTDSPTPTPTRVTTHWGFWNMMFLALSAGNLPLVVTLRGAFMCIALSGGPLSCFAPDTLVLMADGSTRRIADIHPGTNVLSWDEAAGQYVMGTVAGTGGGQADYYYLVNGDLRVTPPHPFYVVERGWTKVADLRVRETSCSVRTGR